MGSLDAPIDRADEIAYVYSQRTHGYVRQTDAWTGPHQLIVVTPPSGRHFHQPYCPRAGLMDDAQYMPLTRALKLKLVRCQLCWPLHRVGDGQTTRPQAVCTAAVGTPVWRRGTIRPPYLSVRLPRLPSPRVRLHAPSPSDFADEWQVLVTFLLAALPRHTPAGPDCAARPASQIVGPARLSGPELLQAARRLLHRAATAETGQVLTAARGVGAHQWAYPDRTEGLPLHFAPATPIRTPMWLPVHDIEIRLLSRELAQRAASARTPSRSLALHPTAP